jgi:hypothetical protein
MHLQTTIPANPYATHTYQNTRVCHLKPGELQISTVDLKGAQPEYSGDLPVDSTAKAFFERVWRLAHCQAQ